MELGVLLLLLLCFPGKRRAGHASGFPCTRGSGTPSPPPTAWGPPQLGGIQSQQDSELGNLTQEWGEKVQPQFPPSLQSGLNVQHL